MKHRLKDQTKGRTSNPRQGANKVYILPVEGGWAVKKGAAKSLGGVYQTKSAATKAAREELRKTGSGELRIHDRNGRIRDSYVMSRRDFEKVSAVEGLFLSDELKRDFDEFDRKGQSDAQRRKKIVQKYAKPRV